MKDWGTRLNLKNSLKSNYNILRSNLASDIMSTALVTVTENYTLKQLAEGNHPYSERIKKAELPMILVSSSAL